MSEVPQTLTVVIPLRVKPRGGRKAMVTPGVLALERRQDITLIKAVARAFRWRRMLESGRFATINELASAEKINSSYVSRVLRLTLLAPDIVEAILDGRQPEGMTLPVLIDRLAAEWLGQVSNSMLEHEGDLCETPCDLCLDASRLAGLATRPRLRPPTRSRLCPRRPAP
ncbi:hypothetical protein [Roseomonas sp. HF4]|uniref:hypothetical protein n=1 Tax=Roseomonas sp. HF4 TaxID=2562313 RepID=UPI001F0F0BF0|nr:hypothetical protein [Roseomonas sp. HF4]